MMSPMSLQILHKKSTSKSITWLHVEQQKESNSLYPMRFTILKESKEKKIDEIDLIKILHVGDIIELVDDCESLMWKRPDLLYMSNTVNVKLKAVWRDTQLEPFKPVPPPPKETKLDKCELGSSRNIEIEYCKYWIHSQQCPFASQANQCPRLHPLGSELKKIRCEWVEAKKQYRKSITSSDDPHKDSKTSKASKAKVFADFLIATYHLSSSSFLIDIAAGRGTISIELFLRHKIKSILIDPRDDCGRGLKYQEKQMKLIEDIHI
jgi:hypothetical protein